MRKYNKLTVTTNLKDTRTSPVYDKHGLVKDNMSPGTDPVNDSTSLQSSRAALDSILD